ncbi:hypothetical protein B0H13DRAFT_2341219 [Mycena leptocephala]|nr:hypothetical protein B0H13DRAFT_2341219 [Mycena leptocephala]
MFTRLVAARWRWLCLIQLLPSCHPLPTRSLPARPLPALDTAGGTLNLPFFLARRHPPPPAALRKCASPVGGALGLAPPLLSFAIVSHHGQAARRCPYRARSTTAAGSIPLFLPPAFHRYHSSAPRRPRLAAPAPRSRRLHARPVYRLYCH